MEESLRKIMKNEYDFSLDEIIERFQQWFTDKENLLPLIILGFMLFVFILGIYIFNLR